LHPTEQVFDFGLFATRTRVYQSCILWIGTGASCCGGRSRLAHIWHEPAPPDQKLPLKCGQNLCAVLGLNQSRLAKRRGRFRLICCLRTLVVPWTRCTDSRRAGAVTQVPSESSHRTRSIAAMTAGSSVESFGPQGLAFVVIHTSVGRAALSNRSSLQAASPVVWCLALLVVIQRDWANVPEPAVRPALRSVERCAAATAPGHVPVVACAPHGADGPSWVGVVVAVGSRLVARRPSHARWVRGRPRSCGGIRRAVLPRRRCTPAKNQTSRTSAAVTPPGAQAVALGGGSRGRPPRWATE
jgi:hypothetical protein